MTILFINLLYLAIKYEIYNLLEITIIKKKILISN